MDLRNFPVGNVESLYDLFGVSKTCTDEQLRKSFCQAIAEVHPDLNPQDVTQATAKTQEINAAYQALKRHRYKPRPDAADRSTSFDVSFKFSFGLNSGVDVDDIANRKDSFRQQWEKFRSHPTDPISALLLIHASFEVKQHNSVKELLLNPVLIDIASLLLTYIRSNRACSTLMRWADFLGAAARQSEAIQILEDAFATGLTEPIIKDELRSWHYRCARYADPTTGAKTLPNVRTAHLSRILELGFRICYVYKFLAESYDELARICLCQAYETDPNVSGAVRISRALGLPRVDKPTQPREAPNANTPKWTHLEQIPSEMQIHEWVRASSWVP
jgi:curved DNA-binding protein CbpA